jgi:hypothetical protein
MSLILSMILGVTSPETGTQIKAIRITGLKDEHIEASNLSGNLNEIISFGKKLSPSMSSKQITFDTKEMTIEGGYHVAAESISYTASEYKIQNLYLNSPIVKIAFKGIPKSLIIESSGLFYIDGAMKVKNDKINFSETGLLVLGDIHSIKYQ